MNILGCKGLDTDARSKGTVDRLRLVMELVAVSDSRSAELGTVSGQIQIRRGLEILHNQVTLCSELFIRKEPLGMKTRQLAKTLRRADQ